MKEWNRNMHCLHMQGSRSIKTGIKARNENLLLFKMHDSVSRLSVLTLFCFLMAISLSMAEGLAENTGQSDLNLAGNFSGYVTMENGEQQKV
ncbi:MAG: hypothetical protein JJU13_00265, partial [Balneolaceae bacterium]|nr:hypothetical protein [Balneolaceae bacterium]